jgi:N-acyl-D-aspartate/D-glutamate deacylase
MAAARPAAFLLSALAVIAAAGSITGAPGLAAQGAAGQPFDIVIANGRVMDPESSLDAVRNVGISGRTIAAISADHLEGRVTIDAAGLVVAPGFIDLHEHGQERENYQYQAFDGVTTSLELELGTADVDAWYAKRDGKALVNYGVSVGHMPIRMQVMHDPGTLVPAGPAAHRAATDRELDEIRAAVDRGLSRGALAVGLGINYTAAATRWEILDLFRAAAAHRAPVHVHMRYAGLVEPETGLTALQEVIADAAATGASLHVVHITSMGLRYTGGLLDVIDGARRGGLDVTTEAYPYTAASTGLESAIFDPGWQKRLGITYKDLQWAATGERLNEETFKVYRHKGGIVVIHAIPEEIARLAVARPGVMIASDGMPLTGPKVHPRGQGTFARVLGHYVREEHALSLMDALRKMTLMPADRLAARAPAMKNKGRVRVGADADLAVFDPDRIIDRATFDEPLQRSEGVRYLFVNGVAVIRDGQLQADVAPGTAVRAPIAK